MDGDRMYNWNEPEPVQPRLLAFDDLDIYQFPVEPEPLQLQEPAQLPPIRLALNDINGPGIGINDPRFRVEPLQFRIDPVPEPAFMPQLLNHHNPNIINAPRIPLPIINDMPLLYVRNENGTLLMDDDHIPITNDDIIMDGNHPRRDYMGRYYLKPNVIRRDVNGIKFVPRQLDRVQGRRIPKRRSNLRKNKRSKRSKTRKYSKK